MSPAAIRFLFNRELKFIFIVTVHKPNKVLRLIRTQFLVLGSFSSSLKTLGPAEKPTAQILAYGIRATALSFPSSSAILFAL